MRPCAVVLVPIVSEFEPRLVPVGTIVHVNSSWGCESQGWFYDVSILGEAGWFSVPRASVGLLPEAA